MSLAKSLASFQRDSAQCIALVSSAHRTDAGGAALFTAAEREMISVAAFLHSFKLWERFLEESMSKYMAGRTTITGARPKKYARPPSEEAARIMLIGNQRYFDYANHDHVRGATRIYFENGGPYETTLSSIYADLSDLRTMRNAAAHISSTTQAALEGLAQRIFQTPQPNITLYDLLMRTDPRSASGETVFANYQTKLLTTAELIANG